MIPAKPPNEIIQSFLWHSRKYSGDIQNLGKECNLTIEEIKLCLGHFRQVEIKGKIGAEKAKEAQREKA